MDNYHITKDDDHWKLKKQGGSRATLIGGTKQQVIDKTREFMEDKTASVKIHKTDGKIQEERTYQRSDDPSESKG
ncbi:MAG: hypothetical protein COA78_34475 [Blastopirellula sp.]|nr:MAG: hypothetical protein COA78_34475 [Blastopirellula sp.]